MECKVMELVGQRCITKNHGQQVYDLIHPLLLQGQTVTLNFEGVKQFASPFFNSAIGQLLKDIKDDDFARLLHFEKLSKDSRLVVSQVIENAKNYHRNIDYKQMVDSILQQTDAEN